MSDKESSSALNDLSALIREPELMVIAAKRGKTDEQIERNVETIIDDVKNLPRSPYYWDHNDGWKEDAFIARVEREITQNRERLTIIKHSSMLGRGHA